MNPGNSSASSDPDRGVIFLLGLSGSGKGTVGQRLLTDGLTQAQLSIGDLLRGLIASVEQNPINRAAVKAFLEGDPPYPALSKLEWLAHCVEKGLLVPNAWTQAVIEHQLTHQPQLQNQPWSIDGYPRIVGAARHLLEALSRARVAVWAVVHLRVSEPEATPRLLARGRPDDTAGTIAERFRFFRENVLPTLDYLEDALGSGRVFHIDAEGSSEAVYARVKSRLTRL